MIGCLNITECNGNVNFHSVPVLSWAATYVCVLESDKTNFAFIGIHGHHVHTLVTRSAPQKRG